MYYEDDFDYEKETWDAMTDGMYGDMPEGFDGDYDWLGFWFLTEKTQKCSLKDNVATNWLCGLTKIFFSKAVHGTWIMYSENVSST